MTPEELQAELALSGIICKVLRGEVFVEVCWFCANPRWNLQLDPTHGRFICWACGTGKGERLDRILQDRLGHEVYLPTGRRLSGAPAPPKPQALDFAHRAIHDVPSAAHYLARRGLPLDVAERYQWVVCTEPTHQLQGRLVAPIPDFWTGNIMGYLGRTYTNQRPKYLTTLRTRMIAGYRVRSTWTPCIIVEGLFDAIAVHRAGYHAAALLGTSAPQLKEFGARLSVETPLVIMLDGAAWDRAQQLRWALQVVRSVPVSLVSLPQEKDPADLQPETLHQFVEQVFQQQHGSKFDGKQTE